MMDHSNVYTYQLDLSEEARQELNDQYQLLLTSIERRIRLLPRHLDALRPFMRKHLERMPEFKEIYEDTSAKKYHIHLQHSDNTILNLPWRLAVEDRQNIHITKGTGKNGAFSAYQPKIPLPLKILVMVSAPEDIHETGRLDYETEERRILEAFEGLFSEGRIEIDFTEDGSLESLAEKLRKNRYHILHFSGHGAYTKKLNKETGKEEGTGYLLLENKYTLNQERVSATQFANTLNIRSAHLPALVVLSSCQTSQGELTEGIKGVVNHLLSIGVPSVVGMSFSISDYFATSFAATLYKEIAEKADLAQAFTNAYQEIKSEEAAYLLAQSSSQLPSQWMIPQLYMSQYVKQLVDWYAPFEPLSLQSAKFITGKERLLLEPQDDYVFIGRRKERRDALQYLRKDKAVLLKGQGGVGKTSLAEHLVSRWILEHPKTQPFVINEQDYSTAESLFQQMIDYLASKHRKYRVKFELDKLDTNEEKFLFLLETLGELCDPIFVFDNVESFQEGPRKEFKAEFVDIVELLQMLFKFKSVPLILTGRYPLANSYQVPTVNLNQVAYPDFFRKCLQLNIRELRTSLQDIRKREGNVFEKTTQLQFPDLVRLLHQTLGGNYRALAFFDQLYVEKKEEILPTLKKLEDFRSKLEKEYKAEVVEKLQNDSRKLVFEELWEMLHESEKNCLMVLSQFRVPVLDMGVEMQGVAGEVATHIERLVDVTLLEKQIVTYANETTLAYYYVTPLVRDYIAEQQIHPFEFSQAKAGEYFEYVDKNINHRTYSDLEEAFWHYNEGGEGNKLIEIGDVLCDFYFGQQVYPKSLYYGNEAIKYAKEIKNEAIARLWDRMGRALSTYVGDQKTALSYLESSLKIRQEIGDRQGEGSP